MGRQYIGKPSLGRGDHARSELSRAARDEPHEQVHGRGKRDQPGGSRGHAREVAPHGGQLGAQGQSFTDDLDGDCEVGSRPLDVRHLFVGHPHPWPFHLGAPRLHHRWAAFPSQHPGFDAFPRKRALCRTILRAAARGYARGARSHGREEEEQAMTTTTTTVASPFDLSGSTALVTGASRGLGHAIALDLARAGADVVLGMRDPGDEHGLVAEIGMALGRTAMPVAMDVTDLDQSRAAINKAFDAFGSLDILVNDAGGGINGPALEVTEADFDAVWALNTRSTFFLSQHAARRMIATGGGAIVNIASQAGLVALPGAKHGACAAKAAVVHLTRCLAVEWGEFGIPVNAVAPTFIETDGTRAALSDPEFRADTVERIAASTASAFHGKCPVRWCSWHPLPRRSSPARPWRSTELDRPLASCTRRPRVTEQAEHAGERLGHGLARMSGRDPAEPHRASTPLELLFDLAFVVAFGQAADQLAHLIGEGHVGPSVSERSRSRCSPHAGRGSTSRGSRRRTTPTTGSTARRRWCR